MSFIELVKLLTPYVSFLGAVVAFVVYFFKSRKKLKTATSESEKEKIKSEIKAQAFGLIASAEKLFNDVPKSGSSKLAYVLDNVKMACINLGIDYDESEWALFVKSIIDESNAVEKQKALITEKANIVESIKKEIPHYITSADELFKSIPDGLTYKIEYILNLIKTACDNATINVFDDYDWRKYVSEFYQEG